MRVWEYVSGLALHMAHAHCDCCEAIHVFVGVCVWAYTKRVVTVIAARRCMRVVVCVLLCTRRMVTVIAARLRMMCASVCLGVYRAYAHGRFCEAMHACDNVCLWASTWRTLTVMAARRCMPV
jgi:hypothetical protein